MKMKKKIIIIKYEDEVSLQIHILFYLFFIL